MSVRCRRSRAGYTLSVIQRPSRSLLARRKISATGTVTLALRPSRTTRTLRINLKRNGRVVAARIGQSPSRRRAARMS